MKFIEFLEKRKLQITLRIKFEYTNNYGQNWGKAIKELPQKKYQDSIILLGNVFKQMITLIIFKYFLNMEKHGKVIITYFVKHV